MIYNCEIINSSTTQCISEASSSPSYLNGFSYDGIITNFILITFFALYIMKWIYQLFIGVKNKIKIYD